MNWLTRFVGKLLIAAALSGCATSTNPRDPFEGFNRAMFNFNDALDEHALKPVATAYQENLPSVVQTGIGNFFGNIGDIWTAVNNLLQGKVADGASDFMRVAINSTFGLLGLIDIGSDVGLQKHKQDFGATLGVWGVGSGPYVVLPFFGPTTMRDAAALPIDYSGDLWQNATPIKLRNTGSVLRVVDKRAVLLDASNLLEDAALDRYEFVRDAYLQRRASQISRDSWSSDAQQKEPEDAGKPVAPTLSPSSSLLAEIPVVADAASLAEPQSLSGIQLPDRPDVKNGNTAETSVNMSPLQAR